MFAVITASQNHRRKTLRVTREHVPAIILLEQYRPPVMDRMVTFVTESCNRTVPRCYEFRPRSNIVPKQTRFCAGARGQGLSFSTTPPVLPSNGN